MIHEKRLLVLVGESSGCLRLERTQSAIACRLTGSVRGECVLAVRTGGKLYTFGRFTLPPAYSFTLPASASLDDLVAAVGDTRGRLTMSGGFRRPMPWQSNMEDDLRRAARDYGGAAEARNINDYFLDIVPQDYDDGRIAEVNYYKSNLSCAESPHPGQNDRESVCRTEPPRPEPAAIEKTNYEERESAGGSGLTHAEEERRTLRRDIGGTGAERGNPHGGKRTDEAETAAAVSAASEDPPLSDDDYGARKAPELGSASFYDGVSDQLDKLFGKCERFALLEKLLPGSRWIRVDYDSSGRYYLVGLIGDPVRYICYGVPGEYSPSPPSELAGYCQWLASDAGDPSGKGFWIMYQDAATGKSIL